MAVSSSCEDALLSRPPPRFVAPCYNATPRALVIDCNDAIKEACRCLHGVGVVLSLSNAVRLHGCQDAGPFIALSSATSITRYSLCYANFDLNLTSASLFQLLSYRPR